MVRWEIQGRGDEGEKKWDNCNRIINKICFKKIKSCVVWSVDSAPDRESKGHGFDS